MSNDVEIHIKSKDESSAGLTSARKSMADLGESTDRTATKASTASGAFGALQSGVQLSQLRAEEHKKTLADQNSEIDKQVAKLQEQDKSFKGGNKAIEEQIAKLQKSKQANTDQADAIDKDEKKTDGLTSALMTGQLAFDALSGVTDLATLALSAGSLAKVKDIAVTVAHGIAQKAAAVAAGVWTAAQWLLNIALDANPIGLIIIAIVALIAIIVVIATKTTWFQSIWKAVWEFLKGVGHWFAHDFVDFFKNAFNWIMNKATELRDWITGKFNAVDGIKDAFKSAVNWLIGKWNSLKFTIPSVSFLGFTTPSFTLGVPSIPYLAQGGIIPARPGGRLAVVGEGGEDEAVIPLSRLGNTGGGHMTMHIVDGAGDGVAELIKYLIRTRKIIINGSDGQAVTIG